MKQSKLSKLENKYYYGISRYFWHIVVGIGIIAVFVGALMFLWSQIPSSKKEIVKRQKPIKAAYPEQEIVSIVSILNALPVEKTKKKKTVKKEESPIEYTKINLADSTEIATFESELGRTKTLIPLSKNKSFWEGTGNWGFLSARDKKMFNKTKNPKYKKWYSSGDGFKKSFIDYTDKNKIKRYNSKTNLLVSINNLIENLYPVNRSKLINKYLLTPNIKKLGLSRATETYNTLGLALSKIDTLQQLETFNLLFRFVINNPNDGIPLVKYQTSSIDSVSVGMRYEFLKIMNIEYADNYNNNLNSLKDATNQFLPYLKKINPDIQDIALEIFYKLYKKNNINRNQQIRDIDLSYNQEIQRWESEFQRELANAEAVYQSKRTAKTTVKEISYRSVTIGFATVLIVSLFLLILSMVRNVNKLSQALLENNNILSKSIADKETTTK